MAGDTVYVTARRRTQRQLIGCHEAHSRLIAQYTED